MSELQLIYFADPMCSWCYGFSPVISALADQFETRLPVHLIMGGLHAGNTEPMRPKDKDYIRETWTQVGDTTGQPFDMSFLVRESFTYDTEPPAAPLSPRAAFSRTWRCRSWAASSRPSTRKTAT